jgi:hypothetical protein
MPLAGPEPQQPARQGQVQADEHPAVERQRAGLGIFGEQRHRGGGERETWDAPSRSLTRASSESNALCARGSR